MLQRLDAMESELGALIESLRTGSNRLNADLQLLEGNLTEVSEAVAPRPRFEPEAAAAVPMSDEPVGALDMDDADIAESGGPEAAVDEAEAPAGYDESEAVSEDEEIVEPDEVAPPDGQADGSDDTEGARLIALNMALNGTPREETDRYLAENFTLADRAGLLDEVYASVEG
jgi:hypothetical protein